MRFSFSNVGTRASFLHISNVAHLRREAAPLSPPTPCSPGGGGRGERSLQVPTGPSSEGTSFFPAEPSAAHQPRGANGAGAAAGRGTSGQAGLGDRCGHRVMGWEEHRVSSECILPLRRDGSAASWTHCFHFKARGSGFQGSLLKGKYPLPRTPK